MATVDTLKITVNKGTVRGETRWVVSFREDGRRKRRFFESQGAADLEAESIRLDRKDVIKDWNAMPVSEREMIMIASVRRKKEGGNPVDALLAEKPTRKMEGPSLSKTIDELILAKEQAGRDGGYTNTLRTVLDQFAVSASDVRVNLVTLGDIERFINSKKLAYRSTLRARLSTLFKFAVRREYRPDNPCDRLEAITYHKPPPAIFTPQQFKTAVEWLLESAPRGLAWFALTTGCGLRPQEAEKTNPKRDINFTEGFVKVEAQTTKVRQRRVIYPLPEALQFLKWALDNGGIVPMGSQARMRLIAGEPRKSTKRGKYRSTGLRQALGFEKWPKDITRHTAASYWLASGGTKGHVADMLGNSEKVLKRDYDARMTRAEAAELKAVMLAIIKATSAGRSGCGRLAR